MIHVLCWLWGDKWPDDHVGRLFSGVRRNLAAKHRCVLVTDRTRSGTAADAVMPLDHRDARLLPGCLVRMRAFDPDWQFRLGAGPSDVIFVLDADVVVVGTLDPLLERNDDLVTMRDFNTTSPCPVQGSAWRLLAGRRHDAWQSLWTGEADRVIPNSLFADDQKWMHHKFPDAGAWTTADGVYAFKKRGWPTVPSATHAPLPDGARLVAFPGRDPRKYASLGWVKQHWRNENHGAFRIHRLGSPRRGGVEDSKEFAAASHHDVNTDS